MILSDKTITDLCIKPDSFFDADLFEALRIRALLNLHEAFNSTDPTPDSAVDYDDLRSQAMRPWDEHESSCWQPMIEPFSQSLIRRAGNQYPHPIISRGLTSYGYDVQLADDFKVFTNIHSAAIDPKRLDPKCLVDVRAEIDEVTGEYFVLMPPNSYLLGRTVEYFRIPRDIMVICVGKSTYARSGAIVNVTPIEPGFEGNVVIEISNSTNLPARVYAWEGIAQFMFFRGDRPCSTSYGDRGGKYQGQTGLTLPRA